MERKNNSGGNRGNDRFERFRYAADGSTGSIERVDSRIDTGENAENEKKLPWYKRTVFRKIGYAIIALLIAITLWGYVLTTQNPVRIKRVENVKVRFAGGNEADLKARNLVITGDLDSILSDVAVNVRTRLNDLPRFDNSVGDVVTATVNIGDIRAPGTYSRRIVASSTIGTPESVEPASITFTVENLVKRQIPVTCTLINELPEGYWHNEPRITPSAIIEITGAESIVSRVTSASCKIDLADLTSSIYQSITVDLLDSSGNIVDPSDVLDTIPAVNVKMDVMPYIDLELDQFINLVGELNSDLEIGSVTINPDYLSIAAPQLSTLNAIQTSAFLEQINVEDFTEPGTYTKKVSLMNLPSSVTLISDNNFIITIVVNDRIMTSRYNTTILNENITGQDNERYRYSFNSRSCYVEFTGPAKYLSDFGKEYFYLVLDVGRFSAGTYEVVPKLVVIGDPDWAKDGSVEIYVKPITVIIVDNES